MEKYLGTRLRILDFVILHAVFYGVTIFVIWLGFEVLVYNEIAAIVRYSIGCIFFIAYLGCNLLFFYKMRYNKIIDLLIMGTIVLSSIGMIFIYMLQ